MSHPKCSNTRGGCLEAVVLEKAQNETKQGSVQSPTHSALEIGLGDLWRFLPNKVIL